MRWFLCRYFSPRSSTPLLCPAAEAQQDFRSRNSVNLPKRRRKASIIIHKSSKNAKIYEKISNICCIFILSDYNMPHPTRVNKLLTCCHFRKDRATMKPATNSLSKKKHAIPHVYIILFIIILLATVLTYIVPAGQFDRETVDNVNGHPWHLSPDRSDAGQPV